jgi:hypothetical protein
MKSSDELPAPKEAMIHTFRTIWKYASEEERNYILNIWTTLMKTAEVLSWKPSSQPHEYQLELKEEMAGTHSGIPLGQVIVKKRLKIAFSEEKIPGTNHYRQVLRFPDKGVLIRMGVGWLSKDNPLQQILVEEKQQEIWCTVEVLGQSITRSADDTLAFWKKIHWNA